MQAYELQILEFFLIVILRPNQHALMLNYLIKPIPLIKHQSTLNRYESLFIILLIPSILVQILLLRRLLLIKHANGKQR